MRREIAFILKDDVHLRYNSFVDGEEFRREVVRKCQQLQKVDIGAVYNRPPREKKLALGDFYACERELVFDIDLTDYDEIRTCCRYANSYHILCDWTNDCCNLVMRTCVPSAGASLPLPCEC